MLILCWFYADFMLILCQLLKGNKGKLVTTRSQLYEQLRPRSKMQNAQNSFLYLLNKPNHAYPDEKGTFQALQKKSAARTPP